MKDYIKRMIEERDLLKDKIDKARRELNNPPFGLDGKRHELLIKQVFYMDLYFSVLIARIGIEKDELRKQNTQN